MIILAAAVTGYVGGKLLRESFYVLKFEAGGNEKRESIHDPILADSAQAVRPTIGRAVKVLAVCLSLWFGPILLIYALNVNPVYTMQAIFFSKTAVVTFGGAYAVLAYIAQEAVESYHWLEPGEMLDGLGMAETTPGPLIQVVQFVGFMGAYRNPGRLDPMAAGVIASVITTWVTFVPCFLWIFLGAPYIEYLRERQALSTALSGITAAVVGVVLNLAVWFSIHTLFRQVNDVSAYWIRLPLPVLSTVEPIAVLISIGALSGILRFRVGMIKTLTAGALLGLVYYLLFKS